MKSALIFLFSIALVNLDAPILAQIPNTSPNNKFDADKDLKDLLSPEEYNIFKRHQNSLDEKDNKEIQVKEKIGWKLSCSYARCFNKLNKDDKCNPNITDLFFGSKGDKKVISGKGTYGLAVFDDRTIKLNRNYREYISDLDGAYSSINEVVEFNKIDKTIRKSIQVSQFRETKLLDKKLYGDDATIVYNGKCNFQNNVNATTIILPPCTKKTSSWCRN
jgi:hypothetical protein